MKTHLLNALVESASNDELTRATVKVMEEAAKDHRYSTETYLWGWDDAMRRVKEIIENKELDPRATLLAVVKATDETYSGDVNMEWGQDDAMSKVRDLLKEALRGW